MNLQRLMVLIILICVLGTSAKRKGGLKKLKNSCHKKHCYNIDKSLASLCIYSCVSPTCFSQVYDSYILDYGEIDRNREIEFERCVKKHGLSD